MCRVASQTSDVPDVSTPDVWWWGVGQKWTAVDRGGVQKWSKMCGHPSWMAPRRDNTPDHTPDRNIQNKYCCNSTRHFFNAPDISFA